MLLIFLLIFPIAIILLLSLFTYRKCFYSSKSRNYDPFDIPAGEQYQAVGEHLKSISRIMEKYPFEWVSTQSHDGLKLYGRYYEFAPGAPVLLLFHGYRSSSLRDAAGGHSLARKLGLNVLAVDQRGHGKSQGNAITFGIQERMDCLKWIQLLREKCGESTPIVLSGLSMGAATVLMAADQKLPENVVGILADCPYSSPSAIIRKVCKQEGYPEKLVFPFLRLGALLFGKFHLTESAPETAAANAQIPILLLHGEDDRFVPCDMSRRIREINPERIRLETFPGAGHGLCYISDPIRYERLCIDFLRSLPEIRPYLNKSQYVQQLDNTLEVVAALIRDTEGRILICQRPENKKRGLLWEFVGGKVEPGESRVSALIRECREELDITVNVGSIFTEVLHEYPDTCVHLTLFSCTIAQGTPKMLEHNDMQWIYPSQIPQYEFCPADAEILALLMKQADTL